VSGAYIGIDPGLDGGIAYIHGYIVGVHPMPKIKIGTKEMINTDQLRDWISALGPIDLIMIEDVNSNACRSIQTAFSFGRGFGRIETLVKVLERPHDYVSSPTWLKHFGIRHAKGATQKERKAEHIAVARRLFPSVVLRDTQDGPADALLIAEYARRLHTGRLAA
jgi:crossover junction endodeoxyribonuclease RuvC